MRASSILSSHEPPLARARLRTTLLNTRERVKSVQLGLAPPYDAPSPKSSAQSLTCSPSIDHVPSPP